ERERFPCLDLAYQALRAGGTIPAALSAANEIAVQAFLDRRIGFLGIADLVGRVLERHRPDPIADLEDVLDADRAARRTAEEILAKGGEA
ncbi:MAG TPA: 1-deoxy-D-xylulose-5-phosphate reductoisomerase, partial [Candidatus Polarisedimenticolia bacterium]|nr:1-deoxy-D-xylulose-5-phosphate reductoisomerase [Candidatus Polarisedimenticolia bacterium]